MWVEGLGEDRDANVSMERKQGERLLGVDGGGGRVFNFRMGADDDRLSSVVWTTPHTPSSSRELSKANDFDRGDLLRAIKELPPTACLISSRVCKKKLKKDKFL